MSTKKKNYSAPKEVEMTTEEAIEIIEKTAEEPIKVEDQFVEGTIINCEKLNLRAKPAKSADVLDILDAVAKIMVAKFNDIWMKAEYEGLSGFVMAEYVES